MELDARDDVPTDWHQFRTVFRTLTPRKQWAQFVSDVGCAFPGRCQSFLDKEKKKPPDFSMMVSHDMCPDGNGAIHFCRRVAHHWDDREVVCLQKRRDGDNVTFIVSPGGERFVRFESQKLYVIFMTHRTTTPLFDVFLKQAEEQPDKQFWAGHFDITARFGRGDVEAVEQACSEDKQPDTPDSDAAALHRFLGLKNTEYLMIDHHSVPIVKRAVEQWTPQDKRSDVLVLVSSSFCASMLGEIMLDVAKLDRIYNPMYAVLQDIIDLLRADLYEDVQEVRQFFQQLRVHSSIKKWFSDRELRVEQVFSLIPVFPRDKCLEDFWDKYFKLGKPTDNLEGTLQDGKTTDNLESITEWIKEFAPAATSEVKKAKRYCECMRGRKPHFSFTFADGISVEIVIWEYDGEIKAATGKDSIVVPLLVNAFEVDKRKRRYCVGSGTRTKPLQVRPLLTGFGQFCEDYAAKKVQARGQETVIPANSLFKDLQSAYLYQDATRKSCAPADRVANKLVELFPSLVGQGDASTHTGEDIAQQLATVICPGLEHAEDAGGHPMASGWQRKDASINVVPLPVSVPEETVPGQPECRYLWHDDSQKLAYLVLLCFCICASHENFNELEDAKNLLIKLQEISQNNDFIHSLPLDPGCTDAHIPVLCTDIIPCIVL